MDDSEDENADDVAEDEEEEEEEEVQDNPQSDCTYTDFSIANSGAGQIGENPDKPWFRYLHSPPQNLLETCSHWIASRVRPIMERLNPGPIRSPVAITMIVRCVSDGSSAMPITTVKASSRRRINIHSMAGVGSVFDATFDKVVLHEVTINPETYVSTRVQNGETWCLMAIESKAQQSSGNKF